MFSQGTPLERFRFLLGDRKTHDEVVAKFRSEVLGRGGTSYVELVGASPYIETVAALGDLLFREEGGGPGGDMMFDTAATYTATAIHNIISRSPELPTDVVEWARNFPPHVEDTWKVLVRDWWKKNEKVLREKRYKEVVPGIAIKPNLASSGEAMVQTPATSGVSQSPSIPSKKNLTVRLRDHCGVCDVARHRFGFLSAETAGVTERRV
jgi:hypothetical protein